MLHILIGETVIIYYIHPSYGIVSDVHVRPIRRVPAASTNTVCK